MRTHHHEASAPQNRNFGARLLSRLFVTSVFLLGCPLVLASSESAIYFVHSDHLGTPQQLTDKAAQVVWAADYEPFGKVSLQRATESNDVRFPGQYFDAETGLHYNYFRDYDSYTGRYIESDPIGLRGGLNTYPYPLNPIMDIDPLGLATWTVTDNFEVSAAAGIGGGFYNLELESECYEGKKYKLQVLATGPAAGLQAKCKACFSAPAKVQINAATFDDNSGSNLPDPGAFDGPFLAVSAEAQFLGFGGGVGDVLLGRARSIGPAAVNIRFGTFSIGIIGIIGTSTVVDRKVEQCKQCE